MPYYQMRFAAGNSAVSPQRCAPLPRAMRFYETELLNLLQAAKLKETRSIRPRRGDRSDDRTRM